MTYTMLLDIMIVVGVGAIVYYLFAFLYALLLAMGFPIASWWGRRQARKRFGPPPVIPGTRITFDENGVPCLENAACERFYVNTRGSAPTIDMSDSDWPDLPSVPAAKPKQRPDIEKKPDKPKHDKPLDKYGFPYPEGGS